jgi:WD40 repeat protein
VLRGHEGSVTRAAFSPDGARILTASDDGTAIIRPYETLVELVSRLQARAEAADILSDYEECEYFLRTDGCGPARLPLP